jgi:hypothetical protein
VTPGLVDAFAAFWPRDLKTWVDVIGTLTTALAVIVAGVWAYYRFVKDRVYRPRLEVGLFAQWRTVEERALLHARITVKNIGATKTDLVQDGTGLIAQRMASAAPEGVQTVAWANVAGCQILERHKWIEPGETVSEDVLVGLGFDEPTTVRLEARLRWKWSGGADPILVIARKIIPIQSRLDGPEPEPQADEDDPLGGARARR